ncbi:MAG TPA: hypothetical protein VGQ00_01285 [Candidatus Norongarragalinales archaeon]|jgi:hypothetical protein|nr:hypothetical protein [Candidatus Norongarragalinales archaeon]
MKKALIISSLALAFLLFFAQQNTAVSGQSSAFVVSGCTFPIRQGWNLISVCANATNTSIVSTLSSISGGYRYVMRWNATLQNFDIYSPRSQTNPFYDMYYNESYFVYYTQNESTFVTITNVTANLTITGNITSNFVVPMIFGWNFVGYPFRFGANITRFFNASQQRYLMKWDNTNQSFQIYSPRSLTNPFQYIDTGEGQLIYCQLLAGCNVTYNTTYLQS